MNSSEFIITAGNVRVVVLAYGTIFVRIGDAEEVLIGAPETDPRGGSDMAIALAAARAVQAIKRAMADAEDAAIADLPIAA